MVTSSVGLSRLISSKSSGLVTRNAARAISSASASSPLASPTPTASTSQPSSTATHYRVTLRRSAIGLPTKAKATLESLGLHRRLQSVYQPQRADIAGMILAVKELVHVENVKKLGGQSDKDERHWIQVFEESMVSGNEDERIRAVEKLNGGGNGVDGVWLNENDEVVDWGGKQARKAPRGYKVVGNISNPIRNQEILQSRSGEE